MNRIARPTPPRPAKIQSGQGVVEYGLILVLCLLIVCVALAVAPSFSRLLHGESAVTIATPVSVTVATPAPVAPVSIDRQHHVLCYPSGACVYIPAEQWDYSEY